MNTRRKNANRKQNLFWMTGTALMMAVTLLLGSTPLGLITTPFLTATTLHIPVIIATLALGLRAGLLTGLVFGVQSFFNSFTSPSFLGPFFLNPLVSVLPRVLFPVCVHGVAQIVRRVMGERDRAGVVTYTAASALGTAMHTAMVMGMMYLLNAQKIAAALVNATNAPQAIMEKGVGLGLAALAVSNGLPEMLVAAAIAPAVTVALVRVRRKS